MTQTTITWRYSPEPQATYGPQAAEALNLRAEETWNLAYLSHDFLTAPWHPDIFFTRRVVHTCNLPTPGGTGRVGDWLLKPAPEAVKFLSDAKVYRALPMYHAYGQQWLSTIKERSYLCHIGGMDDADMSVTLAESVLKRFTLGGSK